MKMPETEVDPSRRWHYLSIGDGEHPSGALNAPDLDLSARDSQLAQLESDLYEAEEAEDGERLQQVLQAQHELLAPERANHRAVIDAANGLSDWPADVLWTQEDGPKRWPPLVKTMESNVDFVDERAEAELSRLLPAGSWTTTPARLRDRHGNEITSHRLLVVSATVRVLEWEAPDADEWGSFEMVAAVAETERVSQTPLARARGQEPFGTGLWVHPKYAPSVADSRVLNLTWSPIPWESEVEHEVRGWNLLSL